MSALVPLFLLWLIARGGILAPAAGPAPAPTLKPPAPPGPSPLSTPAGTYRPPGSPPPFLPVTNPAAAAANANAAQQKADQAAQTAVLARKAAVAPAPWPSVSPTGLPPFPSGWKPHPRPGTVAVRAMQLLPVLWARGKGSHVVEKANGEWTAFKAQETSPGKKGVTAWLPSAQPQAQAASPLLNV